MPESLRNQYQYFTQAEMDKLHQAGCPVDFSSLEDSVRDYVVNYLQQTDPHLGM
jgi:ADP-L-glycero-D-manno-heptose 6-epimerase